MVNQPFKFISWALKAHIRKILLNDKDEIYNTPYSKLVGYLPQDAFIIDDNLFSNIVIGQKNMILKKLIN